MIKWMMVVVFYTPGGDLLTRSYYEFDSRVSCVEELDRARSYIHPLGLKTIMSCERMSITKADK